MSEINIVKRISKFIILVIAFSLLLSLLPNLALGYTCEIAIFQTNKETYYYDEDILVYSNWTFWYDESNEEGYVQFQIFNLNNISLWKSSRFDERGEISKELIIPIQDLNITYSSQKTILSIRFFCYMFDIVNKRGSAAYLETREIDIIKRNISCHLNGFKENLYFGDNLTFHATFTYFENVSNTLNHQIVKLDVISGNNFSYNTNYITNQNATITVFLISGENLQIGINQIIINLQNNSINSNSTYFYELNVNKLPILTVVQHFNKKFQEGSNILVELKFFYNSSDILNPLLNTPISFIIYNNLSLVYEGICITNNSGNLRLVIAYDLLDLKTRINEIIFWFCVNETEVLKRQELGIEFSLLLEEGQILSNSGLMDYIFYLLLSVGGCVLLSVFLILKRRKKSVQVSEYSFEF